MITPVQNYGRCGITGVCMGFVSCPSSLHSITCGMNVVFFESSIRGPGKGGTETQTLHTTLLERLSRQGRRSKTSISVLSHILDRPNQSSFNTHTYRLQHTFSYSKVFPFTRPNLNAPQVTNIRTFTMLK